MSEEAWDALEEALAVFWWFRDDLRDFLYVELDDAPELLARIDFSGTKRNVASALVTALRRREEKYQGLVIDLLIRLGSFDKKFPRLARLEGGEAKVEKAKAALADVVAVVERYSDAVAAREQIRAEADRIRQSEERRRKHDGELAKLRGQFLTLHEMDDSRARGTLLETLLNDLFQLFELNPRAAYNLAHEQIDGAFTFRTDDYLLEARWWKTPLQPKHLSEFKGKVESKAKNVLGLLVAVGGFTSGAIERHSTGTPLVLMDGADLFAILDGRISLTEVLERKRRHAAETGSPMLPVYQMLG